MVFEKLIFLILKISKLKSKIVSIINKSKIISIEIACKVACLINVFVRKRDCRKWYFV